MPRNQDNKVILIYLGTIPIPPVYTSRPFSRAIFFLFPLSRCREYHSDGGTIQQRNDVRTNRSDAVSTVTRGEKKREGRERNERTFDKQIPWKRGGRCSAKESETGFVNDDVVEPVKLEKKREREKERRKIEKREEKGKKKMGKGKCLAEEAKEENG